MGHNEQIQPDQMMSIREFCLLSGVCKTTTYKLINTRQLKSTKVLRRRLISRKSAQSLINPSDNEGGI